MYTNWWILQADRLRPAVVAVSMPGLAVCPCRWSSIHNYLSYIVFYLAVLPTAVHRGALSLQYLDTFARLVVGAPLCKYTVEIVYIGFEETYRWSWLPRGCQV
jgi:hypothetical protein